MCTAVSFTLPGWPRPKGRTLKKRLKPEDRKKAKKNAKKQPMVKRSISKNGKVSVSGPEVSDMRRYFVLHSYVLCMQRTHRSIYAQFRSGGPSLTSSAEYPTRYGRRIASLHADIVS